MDNITYKSKDLAEAEDRYRNVHLEQRQRELVNFLGTWFSKRIDMGELPCRGYWVLAVVEWQMAKKRAIASVQAQTPAERTAAAKEIAEHFKILVSRALTRPDQRERLEAAIRDGMVEYQRLYANA